MRRTSRARSSSALSAIGRATTRSAASPIAWLIGIARRCVNGPSRIRTARRIRWRRRTHQATSRTRRPSSLDRCGGRGARRARPRAHRAPLRRGPHWASDRRDPRHVCGSRRRGGAPGRRALRQVLDSQTGQSAVVSAFRACRCDRLGMRELSTVWSQSRRSERHDRHERFQGYARLIQRRAVDEHPGMTDDVAFVLCGHR